MITLYNSCLCRANFAKPNQLIISGTLFEEESDEEEKECGQRRLRRKNTENAKSIDLSDVLSEEVEEKVKEAAEISMGTKIIGEDIININ